MTIIGKAIDAILKIDQAWFDIPLWEDPNGNSYNAQCDANGYLYVNIGGAIVTLSVEGAVADHDLIDDTKPVVTGGVYFLDPTANPLDNGDAGWTLINAQRMAVVDNRAIVQDADPAPILDGTLQNLRLDSVGRLIVTDPTSTLLIENTDPAPMVDGTNYHMRLDSVGRLIVTDPAASPYVEGPDADDDPVTGNPVTGGGVYFADPTANPIDDGDVGYILLNELRMQITESRTYDAASDADKNLPVWNETDLWTTEDLSGTRTSDGKSYYYVSMEEYSRYSIQFIPIPDNEETIDFRILQSNDDNPDITARTYTDITLDFFGCDKFGIESWVERETPTRAKSLKIEITVAGYTAGTAAWTMYLMKGGNS